MTTTEDAISALPKWDLTPIFPSITSPEFAAAFADVRDQITSLDETFESECIRRRDIREVDAEFVALYESVTNRLNLLLQQIQTLSSYIVCHVTTDAQDDEGAD